MISVWYNSINPIGNMIFLNNHVLGTSWLTSVDVSHKILPTLYILRGKQAGRDFKVKGGHETKNPRSRYH